MTLSLFECNRDDKPYYMWVFAEKCVCCGNRYGFEYNSQTDTWSMGCCNDENSHPKPCRKDCVNTDQCPLEKDRKTYQYLLHIHLDEIRPVLWWHFLLKRQLRFCIPIREIAAKYEELNIFVEELITNLNLSPTYYNELIMVKFFREDARLIMIIVPFDKPLYLQWGIEKAQPNSGIFATYCHPDPHFTLLDRIRAETSVVSDAQKTTQDH